MNNIDTILSLLAEGHSIDSIAADFTKALNEAKKIQEETEKEKKITRLEDAEDLIQPANQFFETYFPGTLRFDFTGEELVNAMEELAPELKKLSKLIETFSETPKQRLIRLRKNPQLASHLLLIPIPHFLTIPLLPTPSPISSRTSIFNTPQATISRSWLFFYFIINSFTVQFDFYKKKLYNIYIKKIKESENKK